MISLTKYLAALAIALAFFWMLYYYTGLPLMQVSNATGECVKVLSPCGQYTCEKPPIKFETIRVP